MNSDVARVKEAFFEHGITIRAWARANGFSEGLVYAVLNGKNQALRGESFRIAIALGIKSKPAVPPAHLRSLISERGN